MVDEISNPQEDRQLRCPKCESNIPEGAAYCPVCGQQLASPASEEQANPAPISIPKAHSSVAYAGFWLRLVAYVIDALVLGVFVGFAILMPLMQGAGIPKDNPWVLVTGQSRQIFAINMLITMAAWLYWAVLESSPWQATVGKKLLGLEVTDLEGRRITFARASGRYFGKILSTIILCVGYLMAGFTEKKQALHDILAGCLVKRNV